MYEASLVAEGLMHIWTQVLKGVEEEVTDGQLIMFGDVECSLSAPAVGGLFTMTHEPGSARSIP